MNDFSKRNYGDRTTTSLQGDIERAMRKLREDMVARAIPYTPGEGAAPFWDPQPTTVGEALDRIVVWLEARHSGDMPIT